MLLGVQVGRSVRKCRKPHRLGPSPASGLLFSAVIRLIKHILHFLCHKAVPYLCILSDALHLSKSFCTFIFFYPHSFSVKSTYRDC